tara:strand:- start:27104 stop:27670 length:567 start_codon:yes stop_codon:yes gene_type:complete
MKSFTFLIGILLLVGCSKNSDSSSPQSPTPTIQSPNDKNEPNKKAEINFEKFGLIREFGDSDNAALFGLFSESGKFEISKIVGPEFLNTYQVGILNESSVEKLFSKSSSPLNITEKQNLLSKFNGATIIYTEGYTGNLCRLDETQFEITAIGKIQSTDVEVTFQFVANPNLNGSCNFRNFGILVKYTN